MSDSFDLRMSSVSSSPFGEIDFLDGSLVEI